MNGTDHHFVPAVDIETVQAAVLKAAVAGDAACLARLPALAAAFDEPYRTVVGQVLRLRDQYAYVDANVLGYALAGRRLARPTASGRTEELQAGQVLGLIFNSGLQPGQTAAYLDILQADLQRKRRAELTARIQGAASLHADDPERMAEVLGRVLAAAGAAGRGAADGRPPEILELIPYARQLEVEQSGAAFSGLDSGFPHVNDLCNGLDTGLFVIAARPGAGKTTLVWQMCCNVADVNRVPVLFVSLEQSKKELRAKALARLARLPYTAFLRGGLDPSDPDVWPRVLAALTEYARLGPYLTIVEGDASTTVAAVRREAEAAMRRMGTARCLIAVDYLQAVPMAEEEAAKVRSAKDMIDLHVSEFRRMARDLNACVVCVSSQNRAGYGEARLDVFKESGGIEYGADVAAVLTRDKTASPPADGEYRGRKLSIVKNRNGETGVAKFKFYGRRAEFVETGREELPEDPEEAVNGATA